jgi:hypothetical protein
LISLSKRTSKPKITFSPRPGFQKSHVAKEFDLIYGHVCPVCGNVITAVFKTESEIPLFPYEETTILSKGEKNAGDVLKIIPNDKNSTTCYNVEFLKTESGSVQKLLMKNHIMRPIASQERFTIDVNSGQSGKAVWEAGEDACLMTGVFSEREDLLVKDLFMLFKRRHQLFWSTISPK